MYPAQGSQVSRIERDSHSFRSLVTHSRHTSYFSRCTKNSRLFNVSQRANMTWPTCHHHGGIKHVSPNPLGFCREVPPISQSKEKMGYTIANPKNTSFVSG